MYFNLFFVYSNLSWLIITCSNATLRLQNMYYVPAHTPTCSILSLNVISISMETKEKINNEMNFKLFKIPLKVFKLLKVIKNITFRLTLSLGTEFKLFCWLIFTWAEKNKPRNEKKVHKIKFRSIS